MAAAEEGGGEPLPYVVLEKREGAETLPYVMLVLVLVLVLRLVLKNREGAAALPYVVLVLRLRLRLRLVLNSRSRCKSRSGRGRAPPLRGVGAGT